MVFLWRLAYGLLDVLNKHFQQTLNITKQRSTVLQAAYFGAYFLIALSAGMLMQKVVIKKELLPDYYYMQQVHSCLVRAGSPLSACDVAGNLQNSGPMPRFLSCAKYMQGEPGRTTLICWYLGNPAESGCRITRGFLPACRQACPLQGLEAWQKCETPLTYITPSRAILN